MWRRPAGEGQFVSGTPYSGSPTLSLPLPPESPVPSVPVDPVPVPPVEVVSSVGSNVVSKVSGEPYSTSPLPLSESSVVELVVVVGSDVWDVLVGSVDTVVVVGSVVAPVSVSSPAGQPVSARPIRIDDAMGADVERCSAPQCGHRVSYGKMCSEHEGQPTNRAMTAAYQAAAAAATASRRAPATGLR